MEKEQNLRMELWYVVYSKETDVANSAVLCLFEAGG